VLLTCKLVAETPPTELARVEEVVKVDGREVCAAFNAALVATVMESEDVASEEDRDAAITDGCVNSDPIDEVDDGFDDIEELHSCQLNV
jgi:hypothetical protein